MDRKTGTIKWFDRDKGYGFISYDGSLGETGGRRYWPSGLLRRLWLKPNDEVFVDYSTIEGAGLLSEGQRVEFAIEDGAEGPRAICVRVLPASDSTPEC